MPAEAEARRRVITVRTAAELVRAIGSHRTIRVMPGVYRLDGATGVSNRHVYFSRVHDGQQLNVRNVKGLTIEGVGAGPARLLVAPRYAWVLRFEGSQNVTLKNLELGHTRAGGCRGGVVAFERSRNVKVLTSDLHGSGTHGVGLDRVQGFLMDQSVIRDCTYGIMTVKRSRNVRFRRSTFRRNRQFDLIEVERTPQLRFDQCTMTDNRTGVGHGYAFFKLDKHSHVRISGGTYARNAVDRFVNLPRQLSVVGSAALRRQIASEKNRPDPRYNQIYRIVRYRNWIVTGSQAGIAFIDVKTGKAVKLIRAYISYRLLVSGKHLWAGTYNTVMRFDGLRRKTYLRGKVRGYRLFRGPRGQVMVRSRRQVWRYDATRDRLIPVQPAWLPAYSVYGLVMRPSGAVWSITFLRGLTRWQGGQSRFFPRKGVVYPGADPRRFYQSSRGQLWVMDFDDGFYRYDPGAGRFNRDPTVSRKASAMAIDYKRRRTWLLHYTRGLYLRRPGHQARLFNLSHLRYMRDLYADPGGDVFVGSWAGVVHLTRRNGIWKTTRWVIR